MPGRRCPRNVQDLLVLGTERGVLDWILADVLKAYEAADDEESLARQMCQVFDQWQGRPASSIICTGCMERELDKILRRAKVEQAREVILEQEEERFFHQWYVEAKPVHVIEPSHSLTYRTILKTLSDAAEASQPLKPWNLEVLSDAPRQFRLVGEGVDLKILFR